MATYVEIYEMQRSGYFQQQLTVALSKAFSDIRNEDPGAADHANRLTVANKNPETIAAAISWDVLANATLQSYAGNPEGVPDVDMQFVASSLLSVPALVARLLAER